MSISVGRCDAAIPALHYQKLLQRIGFLAFLYFVELLVITMLLNDGSLAGRSGMVSIVSTFGAWILRAIVAAAVLAATFLHLGYRPVLLQLSNEFAGARLDRKLALGHASAIACFGVLSFFVYQRGWTANTIIAIWLLTGSLAVVFGALAVLPGQFWSGLLQKTGYLWISTAAAVLILCLAGNASRALWSTTARATFVLTRAILTLFVPHVVSDLGQMSLGTPRFHVEIAPECSGLEGMALITAFGLGWLALFRKECRFPHAFLLIPAGVVVMFLLNALRITVLLLIGNAGAERIALGGFHSQAGWIAFNFVAVGFVLCAGSVPGIMAAAPAPPAAVHTAANPVAPWVIPFVVILAVGMLSRAFTEEFEWLYPLRLIAAAAAIAAFRQTYRSLDLRFDWSALAAGLIVFILWIGADHFSTTDAMPRALAMASPAARTAWIVCRLLAASITVPIAEELAFRGYLLRRISSPDFESVSFGRLAIPALLVSSLAFGLLHGDRWLVGTLAGLVYAFAILRRGRLMNAIVAHGTTNALLGAYVLAFHQWHLW